MIMKCLVGNKIKIQELKTVYFVKAVSLYAILITSQKNYPRYLRFVRKFVVIQQGHELQQSPPLFQISSQQNTITNGKDPEPRTFVPSGEQNSVN